VSEVWQCGGVWTRADLEAARVAEQQHGVVHGELLRGVGLTSSMIERRLKRGQLRRRAPGVYAFGGSPATRAQMLVVLALSIGPRAAISHDSAAHMWGMINQRPGDVHVVVDRWQREHRADCVVHESLDLGDSDRVWMDGVPLTNASRTIVDLGATSPWLVERALSTSLRLELFTVAEVDGFVRRVARRGRRGVGVIRPLLDMHRSVGGQTESYLEDRFLRVLFDSQIELPLPQFEILEPSGRIVCRADFAYPAYQLLIELDGRSYHSDTIAFQRDRDKQNRTQELGWRTLRFTWNDVFRKPDHVATTVSSFLRN
jgi:hypothetical protein